ncbi:MAG TPA: hypothetical protein VD846_02765 [Allosphingosinicella sp.]|nr:hypothetical protein [Allosphingosinicella sp.]
MRHPARTAFHCFLAVLAGIGLISFGGLREERTGEHWSPLVPLALAPFAFVFLVRALLAARGRAQLLAGRGGIARWHVSFADWERFRAVDGRQAAIRAELADMLWIRRPTPPDGVEVIVGENGLLVDHSYHDLRPGRLERVGWLAGSASCLEFTFAIPAGAEGDVPPPVLRIPVPPGARPEGQRVIDHFGAAARAG